MRSRFFAPSRTSLVSSLCLPALLFLGTTFAKAEGTSFDLTGPRVDLKVRRGANTLAIGNVANLQPGDRLWIHPDLPDNQLVHYLLVVAFLRGSTNPPPENWFTRAEAWRKSVREEGLFVNVPEGAQQALLFLAPDTAGGFGTLRGTVRSKPGIFVRASQDLNQAAFERSRVDKYLDEVKETSSHDPKALQESSVFLARTLNIKVDQQCFDKPREQQAPCLTQNPDRLVLGDGHTQSMVAALTSGENSELIGRISSTPVMAGGAYSPYVGAIVDLAHALSIFHTADYQYIPALSVPDREQLSLLLNNPPSFGKPKSVLVVGLPAVEAAQFPPLRAVNAEELFCLQKSPLVLPVEGAPLVFSTRIAHDLVVHLDNKLGAGVDLPATADAARGGFAIDTRGMDASNFPSDVQGTLRGFWGFDSFVGPTFHLRIAHPEKWAIPAADQSALVIGRDDTLHLQGSGAVCVDHIAVLNEQGKDLDASWKLSGGEQLELQIPLKDVSPGALKLFVKQSGLAQPDEIALHSYSEAAHLEDFQISAGDLQGVLRGTRLDQVDNFELKGIHFTPAKLSRSNHRDELRLAASNTASAVALHAAETLVARVALKDGRVLALQTTVEPPRPKVTLLSKSVQPGAPSAVRLANPDEVPQGARLSFVLKTEVPDTVPHNEKIEVATTDGSYSVLLTVTDGNLIMQDAENLLAVLDPVKNLGPSAFGPLHFRPVAADGAKGDWQPLATLVRLPLLKEIRCPDSPDQPCTLNGTNLFLIDSLASDEKFFRTTPVPTGYLQTTLRVPRPNGTLLYLKLRDDPATVNTLILPVLPENQ